METAEINCSNEIRGIIFRDIFTHKRAELIGKIVGIIDTVLVTPADFESKI